MEWIKDYWYIVLLGLFAIMFIFSRRSNKGQEGKIDDYEHGAHTVEKTSKSGHGCCH